VRQGCGSQNTPVSPLSILGAIRKQRGRGAIVARPCDIRTLRRYLQTIREPALQDKLCFFISFLCDGTPPEIADPGFRTERAVQGRELAARCKYCFDGIGESADVVFGDGWLCDTGGHRDAAGQPGAGIIITRTKVGNETMRQCVDVGYIAVDDERLTDSEFAAMQPTHTMKRRYSQFRVAALRLRGVPYPVYKKQKLAALRRGGSLFRGVRQFAGALHSINRDALNK
jgi:coenzyme F420-reducing hydrogenase beta subunit